MQNLMAEVPGCCFLQHRLTVLTLSTEWPSPRRSNKSICCEGLRHEESCTHRSLTLPLLSRHHSHRVFLQGSKLENGKIQLSQQEVWDLNESGVMIRYSEKVKLPTCWLPSILRTFCLSNARWFRGMAFVFPINQEPLRIYNGNRGVYDGNRKAASAASTVPCAMDYTYSTTFNNDQL